MTVSQADAEPDALDKLRRLTRSLWHDVASWRLRLALKGSCDPNQPRIPQGEPGGGRWLGGGATTGNAAIKPAAATRLVSVAIRRISPALEAECDRLNRIDTAYCKNWAAPHATAKHRNDILLACAASQFHHSRSESTLMIILAHTLYLNRSEGELPIEIRIHQPALADGSWECSFEIDWPEGTKTMSGAGADALQSLVVALQMIGIQIYTSAYHHDGALRAYKNEEGYGFPVSRDARDLLIGADKIYL